MTTNLAALAPPGRWYERRLCAFDLETTSPDPLEARIVSACVARVGGGMATESRCWLVDPGVDIPAEAAAIHGITTERARREGQVSVTAIAEIATALKLAWGLGEPVVIFNAPYDLTVINRELRRNAVSPLNIGPVIDPRVLDKQADAYVGFHRKGSRKLVDQCAHYGVRLDGAHDAAFDAIAAARLAYILAKKFAAFGNAELEELHAAQVRWYAEQAAGLEAYFRRQGKSEVCNREWPVRLTG